MNGAFMLFRGDVAKRQSESHLFLQQVVLARVGRDWGVFQPNDMPFINESEGRPRWLTTLGMWFYYPLVVLAIVGAVLLRRRRVRFWPLLMPPVVVTVGALLSYGQTRFRVPAEPTIVILAAVTVSAMVRRGTQSTIAASSSR